MRIALLGDTALFGKYSLDSDDGIFKYFKEVRELLLNYDFVVANLETPFITNQRPFGYKSAYIGSNVRNTDILEYLGINIINLANNHIFDYGIDALSLTKKVLDKHNIQYFGVEGKEIFIKSGNNHVVFSGYCCYSTNPVGIGDKGINELNFKKVKDCLIDNYQKGWNSILSIHAGQEHINYPNYDHVLFARLLSKYAPYVYYGHHPHVLQGIEECDGSLLAYSLGNFCFDDVYTNKYEYPLIVQNNNNKCSVILSLEYNNNRLTEYKFISLFAGNQKMEMNRSEILDSLNVYSERLTLQKDSYNEMRNDLWRAYLDSRKKQRDFQWYIKRLNIKSLQMILASRRNKRKYNENLKKYLLEYPM